MQLASILRDREGGRARTALRADGCRRAAGQRALIRNVCSKECSLREGTVMARSRIPLHQWLHAAHRVHTAREGISSLWLAKEIGLTQHVAWFMLWRQGWRAK